VGWTLYAAPSYLTRKGPFTPLDFTGHEIILFDAFPWPGGAWLAERSQGATVAMRATTMPAVQDACAAGLGIAMLPCYAADPDTRIERLVPNICGSNDMKIVTHKDLVNVARVRTVIDYLVEIIERDRALWTG